MIGGAAAWPGSKKAHENNFSYSSLDRRPHNISGAFHVNPLIGLLAYFPIDARTMCDRLNADQRFPQRIWFRKLGCGKLYSRVLRRGPPSPGESFVAFLRKSPGQMTAYEPRSAGNCNSHNTSLRFSALRSSGCVGQTALRK